LSHLTNFFISSMPLSAFLLSCSFLQFASSIFVSFLVSFYLSLSIASLLFLYSFPIFFYFAFVDVFSGNLPSFRVFHHFCMVNFSSSMAIAFLSSFSSVLDCFATCQLPSFCSKKPQVSLIPLPSECFLIHYSYELLVEIIPKYCWHKHTHTVFWVT